MTFTAALDVNPPATSFLQFTRLLDDLWAEVSLGHTSLRIDRGFWERHPYERSIASKLRSGLKFLHLLEGVDNDVTPTCLELADPQKREVVLRDVLLTAYQAIMQMARRADCKRPDFERHFGQTYALTNESTVSKSVTFLVSAAAMCGLELAPSLQPAPHNLSHFSVRPVQSDQHDTDHVSVDAELGATPAPQEVFQVSPSQIAYIQPAESGSTVASQAVLKVISGLARELSLHPEWSSEQRAVWLRMIADGAEVLEFKITDTPTGARSASNGFARP